MSFDLRNTWKFHKNLLNWAELLGFWWMGSKNIIMMAMVGMFLNVIKRWELEKESVACFG